MKFFKRGDTRTIWVFAVMGALILVIILSGVWKKVDFFITIASFLGFSSGEPPAGTSIIGVNLEKGDLKYFTGEKWIKIDENTKSYLLGDYNFNPKEIKDSFYNFYVKTPRKPSTLSFESNHWRYWDVGFIQSGWGKATISSATKKGFAGPSNTERANLGYTNLLDYEGIYSISAVGIYFPNFLNFELNPLVLQKTISWRDSILEDNSCESFMPLKISLKTPQLSPPQNQNDPKYTVRKIDEYLFVDLAEPVELGRIESYSKDDCYEGVVYTDVNRDSWKNDAVVQFSYTEQDGNNGWEKVWWLPLKGWVYESHVTGGDDVVLSTSSKDSRVPIAFYDSLVGKGVYEGLIALSRLKGILEQQDAEFDESDRGVFVNSKPVNIDFVKGNEWGEWASGKAEKIDRFIYAVLNEYNKHLTPPPEPQINFPKYLFLLRDNILNLIDENGVSQDVIIVAGKIIAGPLNLGNVGTDGAITIDYASAGISIGQSQAVDFINGKNLFDITYGLDATSPIGFSKFSKDSVPSSFLGISS